MPGKKAKPGPKKKVSDNLASTGKSDGFDETKLNAQEKERLEKYRERYRAHDIVKFERRADENDDPRAIVFEEGAFILGSVGLGEATGTADPLLSRNILTQASATFSGKDPAHTANLALAALHDFQPQDVLEGQLAGQMVGAHNAAMRFLGNAARSTDPDQIGRNVEWATKMMRTYTAQIEALNRYRGKGQQRVIVEHVTVHQGGQAIVGHVTTSTALPAGHQGLGSRPATRPAELQALAAQEACTATLDASILIREAAAIGEGG